MEGDTFISDLPPLYLRCIFCNELFQDPVILECGHTLCRKCTTGKEADDNEHTPDNDELASERTSTEFSDQMDYICKLCTSDKDDTNSQTNGIKDTGLRKANFVKRLAKEHKGVRKGEDICGLCEEDGERKAAKVWCSECDKALCKDCLKVHRKLEASHTVGDVSVKTPRSVKPKCQKHKECLIDLMCEDCDEALCQRCCVLEHRSCKKVTRLEDCLRRLDSLLVAYSKELRNDIPGLESRISVCKEDAEKVIANVDMVEAVIDETCASLVEEIHNQQTELKERVGRFREEEINRLGEKRQSFEFQLADARQKVILAKEVSSSPSALDHFEIYKSLSDKKKRRQKDPDERGHKGSGLTFVDNQMPLLAALQRRRVGYLKGCPEKKPDKDGKRRIDTGSLGLYALTVLTFEGIKIIVTTNHIHKMVQSFYTLHNKEESCIIRLDSPVYGITQLESNKAAVPLPKKRQILIFSATPKLEKESTIKTQLRYLTLTKLTPTTLAASGEESGFIDIIDMKGTRIKSFGADIFSKQLSLCASLDNHILASDKLYDRVVCVTDEGDIQFTYEPQDAQIFSAPRGVAQSIDGGIFVVDRDHHRVVHLDQSGQFVKHFLTFENEISDPQCIHVDDDNMVYVSVDDRYIQIHEHTG